MERSGRRKCLAVRGVLALVAAIALTVLGPKAHYFDSAGARGHYTNEGQGVPLLPVHGLAGTNITEWHRTLPSEKLRFPPQGKRI